MRLWPGRGAGQDREDGRVVWGGGLSLSKLRVGEDIMYTAFVKDVTAEVSQREQFRLLSLVAKQAYEG